MNNVSFLDLPFTLLSMDHRDLIESYFNKYPQKLSWYTFANMFGWNTIFKDSWIVLPDETLLITASIESVQEIHLLQPIGNFSKSSQQLLLDTISKWNYPVKILAVSSEFIEKNPEFCSQFSDYEDRNFSNYLYKATDLALLQGRHFEKKRNLISQLDKAYPWTVVPLKASCPDCIKILSEIGTKENITEDLQNEQKVLNAMLQHYNQLNLTGYMITIDGRPEAFSVTTKLNPSTKVVIFEKANRHFKGLYQLINRETSKAILQEGFDYINREEDLGDEGLRHAKMSYHPIEIVASHTLTYAKRMQ